LALRGVGPDSEAESLCFVSEEDEHSFHIFSLLRNRAGNRGSTSLSFGTGRRSTEYRKWSERVIRNGDVPGAFNPIAEVLIGQSYQYLLHCPGGWPNLPDPKVLQAYRANTPSTDRDPYTLARPPPWTGVLAAIGREIHRRSRRTQRGPPITVAPFCLHPLTSSTLALGLTFAFRRICSIPAG
jgi:hypothetical protein